MSYIYSIRLNDDERKKLDRLVKERGYRRPDIIRAKINDLYKKEFPPYVKPPVDPDPYKDYTPARYCIDILGGVVEGDECVLNNGNGKITRYSLATVKQEKL